MFKIVISTFFCFDASASKLVKPAQGIAFGLSRSSTFSVRKNSRMQLEFYFKANGFEVKQFRQKDFKYRFFKLQKTASSILIAEVANEKTKHKNFAIFKLANGVRYNNEKGQLCSTTAKNLFGQKKSFFDSIEEITKGLSTNVRSEKATQLFLDQSCKDFGNKEVVTEVLFNAIANNASKFDKCFRTEKPRVKNIMEADDTFMRLMMTYYANHLEFANALASNKLPIQFECSDETNDPTMLNLNSSPPKIRISVKNYSSKQEEAILSMESRMEHVLIHELDHLFLKFPSVPGANICEHEYQELIKNNCSEIFVAPAPKCMMAGADSSFESGKPVARTVMDGTVVGPSIEAETSTVGVNTVARPAESTAVAQTGTPVTDTPASDANKGALIQSALSSPNEPIVRYELTAAEVSAVRAPIARIFGDSEAAAGNVERLARKMFESEGNPTNQKAVAALLESAGQNFAKQVAPELEALSELIGVKPVAASVPTGNGSTWSVDDVNAAYRGNLSAGPVQLGEVNRLPNLGGDSKPDSTNTSRAIASQNTNGASSEVGLSFGSAQTNDAKGTPRLAVNDSRGNIGDAPEPSSKLSSPTAIGGAGPATISGNRPSGPIGQNQITDGKKISLTQPTTGPVQIGDDNPYQLKPNEPQELAAPDSAALRTLAGVNAVIGETYNQIRRQYSDKNFQNGLAERGITIIITDGKGKTISTIGQKPVPTEVSRQPSSIDSKINSRNQSSKERVFIDTGGGLVLNKD